MGSNYKKNEFVVAVLDTNNNTLIIYIATLLELINMPIYFFRKAQVFLLISTKISSKYFNFLDIFSSNFVAKLLKYTGIND